MPELIKAPKQGSYARKEDNMADYTDPEWLVRIVKKRPEVGLILHALLLHLRTHGSCTSEDAHGIQVTHPNCRGAAMKLLGKCGCKKNPVPERGTTKQSHGHWLHRWVVYDHQQFNLCLEKIAFIMENVAGIGKKAEQLSFV